MRSVIKAEYEKPVDTLANMNNGMYANQSHQARRL